MHMSTSSLPSETRDGAGCADDPATLRERLRLSEEWNTRLQHQIQELLRLPRNDLEEMRARMEDSDIAIPLLQCYDATIQERSLAVETLRAEVLQLRMQLEANEQAMAGLKNDVRVAEELAAHVRKKFEEEAQGQRRDAQGVRGECDRLRLELTHALEAANTANATAERERKRAAELQAATEVLREEKARLEEVFRLRPTKPLDSSSVDELDAGGEIQRLQLDLLSRENSDKLSELELLRDRMIKTLRQASENHAAHLQLVEERHRHVIEEHREVQRTQELEIQKLRAQLARMEGGTSSLFNPTIASRTTRELLEEQTQRAQAAELRRLSEALSHAQLQKDEAVRRYEVLLQGARQDTEETMKRQQYQTNTLRKQLSEGHQMHRRAQEELSACKEKLKRTQEDLRSLRNEVDEGNSERESSSARLAAAQEQISSLKEKLSRAQAEGRAAVESERCRVDALERRVGEVLRELNSEKSASNSELLRVREERDTAFAKMQAIEQKAQASRVALQGVQLERDQLLVELGRLQDGLELHKQRLSSCELEINRFRAELTTGEQQKRNLMLSMEKMSLENARLVHSRDRLLESLKPTRVLY